jgi:hypothetical protein
LLGFPFVLHAVSVQICWKSRALFDRRPANGVTTSSIKCAVDSSRISCVTIIFLFQCPFRKTRLEQAREGVLVCKSSGDHDQRCRRQGGIPNDRRACERA